MLQESCDITLADRPREFLFDAFGQELGAFDGIGAVWWDRYVTFGGRILADERTDQTVFMHANHLGSISQVTDHAGSVVQDQLFYPWGQSWRRVGSTYDLHFAGFEQSDPSAGLNPTLFRQYNSTHGRWLSPDPLAGDVSDPQSLNRYAYVLNNPTNLTDPLGLEDCGLGAEFSIPCDMPNPAGPFPCRWLAFLPGCIPPFPPFPGGGGEPGPAPQPTPPGGSQTGGVEVIDEPGWLKLPIQPPQIDPFNIVDLLGIGGSGLGGCDFGVCAGDAVPGNSMAQVAAAAVGGTIVCGPICGAVAGGVTFGITALATVAVIDLVRDYQEAHHTKEQPSKIQKHQEGKARQARDRRGQKGRKRPPRTRPDNWPGGKWPPDPGVPWW